MEVSDSSLAYDLGLKATYHASLGIPDYWVIDALRLATHIHPQPSASGYAAKVSEPHSARLEPLLLPALAVRLSDLGLAPTAE